ncbi:MAG: peroxiredoxin [Pseudomonadota bacterium]
MADVNELPADLPVPQDDGGADHLRGRRLPSLALPSTHGGTVDLSTLTGRTVLYIYPATGVPGQGLPSDDWDAIPGARGCTPQSCAFRDHHAELKALGASVLGLSRQTSAVQAEAAARLHLPFALLSDAEGHFTEALSLPVFETGGRVFLKRMTLMLRNGAIEHALYPVFPPDRSADDAMAWLRAHP